MVSVMLADADLVVSSTDVAVSEITGFAGTVGGAV